MMPTNHSKPTFLLKSNLDLPRLAWCAEIKKNRYEATVKCGPWVESINNGFAAGAWDGEYTESRPDIAITLIGSAGRTPDEGFLFCPPSNTLAWLQMVRVDDTIYISNSLPMLLAETDDGPDINHPDYLFDLLEMHRAGLSATPRSLPTAKGRQVQLILYRNLLVQPDLTLRFMDKNPGPAPINFESYQEFLQESVTSVCRNAASADRKHPYSLRCTVSRGYDSTAVAVLAANAGCKQALCFIKSGGIKLWGEDSGKIVGNQLGMEAQEYSRDDLKMLDGLRDHEFYICPLQAPGDKCLLLFDDQIESSVLMVGTHGDIFWPTMSRFSQPDLKVYMPRVLSGQTLIEYSLRKGFLHFPVPFIGARHAPTLHKISNSKSMGPWRLGGHYDRPIPRRIAEDAGIARSLFGISKRGGGKEYLTDILSKSSLEDYKYYLSNLGSRIPEPISLDKLNRRNKLYAIEKRWRRRSYIGHIIRMLFGDRLHPLWRNQWSYSFHWGLSRTRDRYHAALKHPER